jgi:hypothetical protein
VAHHPGDLSNMAEVMRYPGGKQLAQAYRTQLGMKATPIQIVSREFQ